MSAHVHVHLPASDLKATRDFYRAFLGEEPVKEKPDYAKFLPSWAPLNLAISPGTASPSGHYGIQLRSRAAVLEQLGRVKAAGLPVREEIGTTCCYAEQDKFWVKDPDGREWEVYVVNRDVESSAAPTQSCCAS